MAHLKGFGEARGRGLVLAAILALGLVAGALAYEFADDLYEFVQSATMGKLGRAQGHIRY